jgi:RNA polymerase sigma-70 factor, ECF subfamily
MDALIQSAAKGDRNAFGKIVSEHYASVYRFCARRIGPELAQDAAQETFITAQRSLRRFNGRSALSTWLLGIAHNHCRNLARKNRMEICASELWIEQGAGGDETQLVDREALRRALSALSPEHREVVILHEIEGLTYDEAAAVLGVPSGTVKSRLHHAFLNLRKSLCQDFEPKTETAK